MIERKRKNINDLNNDILLYEDKKCRIDQDMYNYIIYKKVRKERGEGYLYIEPTYIFDKNILLWELCDCRKFFDRNSEEARTILKLLK